MYLFINKRILIINEIKKIVIINFIFLITGTESIGIRAVGNPMCAVMTEHEKLQSIDN